MSASRLGTVLLVVSLLKRAPVHVLSIVAIFDVYHQTLYFHYSKIRILKCSAILQGHRAIDKKKRRDKQSHVTEYGVTSNIFRLRHADHFKKSAALP